MLLMFEVNTSFLPDHLGNYFKRAYCSYNYNTRNKIQITNVFILERRRKKIFIIIIIISLNLSAMILVKSNVVHTF